MTTVVNELDIVGGLKTSKDYYKCMGKFINLLIDNEETMFLFTFHISHAEQLEAVKMLNPGKDIQLISTGFCEFDSYDAEEDQNCIPLYAKGYSTSIPDAPYSRAEDTQIIQSYFLNLKKNSNA